MYKHFFAMTAFVLIVAVTVYLIPSNQNETDSSIQVSIEKEMKFSLHSAGDKRYSELPAIRAIGIITVNTPYAFRQFLEDVCSDEWQCEDGVPVEHGTRRISFDVHLDSPGSDVFGALALGREIRALGLNTVVEDHCLSACAYAFLGGVLRTVEFSPANPEPWDVRPDEVAFGLHRFRSGQASSQPVSEQHAEHLDEFDRLKRFSTEEEVAQFVSALLVEYFLEMNVDPSVFVLASRQDSSEMLFTDERKLYELGVISSATTFGWTAVPSGSGTVLIDTSHDRSSDYQRIEVSRPRDERSYFTVSTKNPLAVDTDTPAFQGLLMHSDKNDYLFSGDDLFIGNSSFTVSIDVRDLDEIFARRNSLVTLSAIGQNELHRLLLPLNFIVDDFAYIHFLNLRETCSASMQIDL